MSCSSARGQTEPIAALFAVLVVGAGLALYAGVVDDALGGSPESNVASATLERVEAHLTPDGVVDPIKLSSLHTVTPAGYETNVTLEVAEHRWSFGPPTAPSATAAERTVSVRTGPAVVAQGTLRVAVWS